MRGSLIVPCLLFLASMSSAGVVVETHGQIAPCISPAIAMDGGTAAHFCGGTQVRVKTGGTWTVQQTIPFAGTDLALDDDTLLIGDAAADEVRVYHRAGGAWSLQATWTGPSGTAFGSAVAVSGDRAAVSSQHEDGRVYTYERTGTTWSHDQTLTLPASDSWQWTYAMDVPDNTLAMEGTVLAVGRPTESSAGGADSAGHLRVFERGTSWVQTADLDGTDMHADADYYGDYAYLGAAVAIDNGRIVATGPFAEWFPATGFFFGLDASRGAAFIIESGGTGWARTATLWDEGTGEMGASADIAGSLVAVGSPATNEDVCGSSHEGQVRLYEETPTGWELRDVVDRRAEGEGTTSGFLSSAPDYAENAFGTDVAVSSTTLAATAPMFDDTDDGGIGGNDCGDFEGTRAVLFYDIEPDTDGDGLGDQEEAAAGTDPYHADTDHDCHSDREEAAAGSNPDNWRSQPFPVQDASLPSKWYVHAPVPGVARCDGPLQEEAEECSTDPEALYDCADWHPDRLLCLHETYSQFTAEHCTDNEIVDLPPFPF